jgi:BirA family biotin operon repressor/biotin-[acetyl-CoA-carboxylase] ligase
VLEHLLASTGSFVSGEAICRELNLSRVAVWKHIRMLREQGCQITARPRCGYRLARTPDLPTEEAVSQNLHTKVLGKPLVFFREVDSTNRQLGLRATAGAKEGTVVVSDRQGAGRGRMGRTWHSIGGVNLYCSVLLRPKADISTLSTLPLAAGCAVVRTLAEVAPKMPVQMKWPNDLLVNGRKIGGILCEAESEADGVRHVVVGIGINVNMRKSQLPTALNRVATSLAMETGKTFSRADLLVVLLEKLEEVYAVWRTKGLAPLLTEITKRDALKGKTVCISQGYRRFVNGTADGILADGTLRVRIADGSRVVVHSGDAHIVPKPAAAVEKKGKKSPARKAKK